MLRSMTAIVMLGFACLSGVTADADTFTDKFTNCLVKSSNSSDQVALVQWMFAALALDPSVAPLSSITAEQRDAINQKASDLFDRLIFADCRSETVGALMNDGTSVIGIGFEVLGQVAAGGLMSDPTVVAAVKQRFPTDSIDQDKWAQLFSDAGLPLPQ